MKLCIIGGKGTLGHELATQLQIFGEFKMHILEGENYDIESFEKMNSTLKEMKPEVVIYATEFSDVETCELKPDDAFAVNTHGAAMIANFCADLKAKMVYISSDLVFSGDKISTYHENDTPKPINTYGWSKYLGEKEVQRNLKEHFIVRTARVFGKGQPSIINTVLNLPTNNSMFKVIGDQRGSCTYINDLAIGITGLISKGSSGEHGIYHFVNSGSCTWYEMALKVCIVNNLNIKLQNVSSEQLSKKNLYPMNSTLGNHSSFQFRSWEDALVEYISKR